MGKGSSGGSGAFDYYGTLGAILCEGPVNALHAVIVDGAEVWPRAKAWRVGQSLALNAIRAHGGRTWIATSAHTASTANAPPNAGFWNLYKFTADGPWDDISIPNYGLLRIFWGTGDLAVDSVFEAGGNEFGEVHPAYGRFCHITLHSFLFGRERVSAPNVELVLERKPEQSIVTGTPSNLNDGQANAVAIAAEVLTGQNFLGLPGSALDSTQMNDAASDLEGMAELAALSPLISDRGTFSEFMAELAAYCDLWARWDPSTAKIQVGAYSHGVTPATFHSITVDDLAERPQWATTSWDDVKTRAPITFSDRARAYKESADKADDLRARFVTGESRDLLLQRPWITRREQAVALAAETLRIQGRPQLTGDLLVRRTKGRDILPGDYVRVDIELEPGGAQLLQFARVRQRVIPATGPIRLTLDADETQWPIPFTPGEVLDEADVPEVAPIENLRVIESTDQLAGQGLIVLAERPDPLIVGFHLWYDSDSGGNFSRIGAGTVFATRATLRSDVTASATTIEITVPAQVDSDIVETQPGDLGASNDDLLLILVDIVQTGGDAGQIKESSGYALWEVCSISAQALDSGTDYDLTVLRGRQGTPARAFDSAESEAWIVSRAGLAAFFHPDFELLRANRAASDTPDTAFLRPTPYTFAGELDLADAADTEFRFPPARPSAPSVSLTAPASEPVSITSPYPVDVQITGEWTDPDSDLVWWQIALALEGESDEVVAEAMFTSRAAAAFDVTVKIDQPGGHLIKLRALDARGLAAYREIIVTAGGTGAKVATPQGKLLTGQIITSPTTGWYRPGPFRLFCQTFGATVEWRSRVFSCTSSTWGSFSAWNTYDDADPETWPHAFPANFLGDRCGHQFEVRGTLGGFTTSDTLVLNIGALGVGA